MTRPLCQDCRRRSRCSVAAMQAPQAEDSYLALIVAWEHDQTEGRRYVKCQATTDAVGRQDQARRSIQARRQQCAARPVQANCRGGRALLSFGLARVVMGPFLLWLRPLVGRSRPLSLRGRFGRRWFKAAIIFLCAAPSIRPTDFEAHSGSLKVGLASSTAANRSASVSISNAARIMAPSFLIV